MLVGEQIGPFAVEKEIGCGAMGTVYRARYVKTGLPVAIKVIAPNLASNPTTLARFERETAILKKLKHPNIVRLYATGRVKGTPFYAMEYVEGESLAAVLERRGRFPWEEVVRLGQQICAALQQAHEQGIVHRDLKPANIMVAADGTVKLTDFGIAKGLDIDQLTASNCAMGTAAYMSPEQCRGERNLTAKSDLYALGVVLYELLTGQLPFPVETTMEMFLSHVAGTFERPSRLVLDIPIWLDTLVCQLMEKEPGKRPLDAAMVAKGLDQVVEKVTAQRSAGVEIATSRGVDLKRKIKADETDRAAARTLKEAVSKKKIRRRGKPFYERGWVQAVGIGAVLAALVGVFYWATRPPSAETLIARAKTLIESSKDEDHDKARETIKQLMEHYPDTANAEVKKMRDWADVFDVQRLEHQVRNRLRAKMEPQDDAETKAQAGLRREQDGDLAQAAETWKALAKLKDSKNSEERLWALLAEKRLGELSQVQEGEKFLLTGVQQARHDHRELQFESDIEKRSALAMRYELFGDLAQALKVWQQLQESADKSQRPWALLAAKKIHELKAKKLEESTKLVPSKLEEAAKSPQEARLICEDILALYSKDPEFSKEVKRASEILAQINSKPGKGSKRSDGP